MNLIPSLKYAWLTVKHKWFVFLAGRKMKVPFFRLITHDLSKFSPKELPYYGRQFFGDKRDSPGFARAWLHHQNANDHHWEYWIGRTTHDKSSFPAGELLPMPEVCVREMIADWVGASRAYSGCWPRKSNWPWLDKNFSRIRLHPDTKNLVLSLIETL